MADGLFKTLRAGMKGPTRPKADSAESDEEATMAQGRSRPAWAEIDLAAITHNTRLLSRLVRPARVCAVVKANGYGHGAPAVAKAALAGGAIGVAVALVDEGAELRRHGVRGPILLLSECGPDAIATALACTLTDTLTLAWMPVAASMAPLKGDATHAMSCAPIILSLAAVWTVAL